MMIATVLAAALRILPLGDSITEGSNNQANYRIPLCQKLESKGYEVETVGFRTLKNVDGKGSAIPERWWSHTGISGQRILSDGFRAGYADSLEALLDQAGTNIDVIVFKIGTNDLMRNCPVKDAFGGWLNLVCRILEARPQAKLVLCTILDMPGKTEQVNAFNTKIREALNPEAFGIAGVGTRVFLADLNPVVVRANGDFLDAFHPNWQGHDHTSDVLATVIDTAVKAGGRKKRGGYKSKAKKVGLPNPDARKALREKGFRRAKVLDLPAEGGFVLPETKATATAYLLELKRPGADHPARVAVAEPGMTIRYEPEGYGRFQAWDGKKLIFAFNRFGEAGVNEIGIGPFTQHYLGNGKYSTDYTHTWATPTMNAAAYERRRLEIWVK